jgi:hypothetical protein
MLVQEGRIGEEDGGVYMSICGRMCVFIFCFVFLVLGYGVCVDASEIDFSPLHVVE